MRAPRAAAVFAVVVIGAAAPPSMAVFPREAARLPPIALPDLVYATMLPMGATTTPWDHPRIAAVRWLTLGVEPQVEGGYRLGLARVRVAGAKTTVLRGRREELAWTLQAETKRSVNLGPDSILINPGVEETECFGAACGFRAAAAIQSPRFKATLLCDRSQGAQLDKTYRLTAPGRHPAMLSHGTSCGPGGCNSWVIIPSARGRDCVLMRRPRGAVCEMQG